MDSHDIFCTLIKEIAELCGYSFRNPLSPKKGELSVVYRAMERMLGLEGENLMPKSGESLSKRIRKVAGTTPLDFSDNDGIHKKYAFYHYWLKNPDKGAAGEDINTLINQRVFGQHWENFVKKEISRRELLLLSDWNRWGASPILRSLGLGDAFPLVALCQCLEIKFPLDYDSPLFLNGSKVSEFRQLVSKLEDNDIPSIIRIATQEDYPTSYLMLTDPTAAEKYALSNPEAGDVALRFISELVETISKGRAKDCHSYVFRKLYSYRKSTRHERLLLSIPHKTKAIDLLSRIIMSSCISDENRRKCRNVQSTLSKSLGRQEEALAILNAESSNDGFENYGKACILFERGDYAACLGALDRLPNKKVFGNLRLRCYLHADLIEHGITHYLGAVRKSGGEAFETDHLFDCLDWLLAQEQFELAERYLQQLKDEYAQLPEFSRLYDRSVRFLAKLYYAWAKSDGEHGKYKRLKCGYALSLLQDISKTTHVPHLVTILMASIYLFLDNPGEAERVLEQGSREWPRSFQVNYAYAKYLLHKISSDPDTDLTKAAKLLDKNIAIFAEIKTARASTQAPTYHLYGLVLEALGEREKALGLLLEFIDRHRLVKNKKDTNVYPIFGLVKKLENELSN